MATSCGMSEVVSRSWDVRSVWCAVFVGYPFVSSLAFFRAVPTRVPSFGDQAAADIAGVAGGMHRLKIQCGKRMLEIRSPGSLRCTSSQTRSAFPHEIIPASNLEVACILLFFCRD